MLNRKVWEILRVNLPALMDVMALWGECIDDTRRLDLATLLPGLSVALETLERRFQQINALWPLAFASPAGEGLDQATRELKPLALDIDRAAFAQATPAERAALMNFARHLQILDAASREIVRALRILAGVDAKRGYRPEFLPRDIYRPALWDPQRFVKALFPVLCFIAAFVFWILTDPPGGPKLSAYAISVSLSIMLSWMNPVALLVAFAVVSLFVLAPVYMVLMPALETGAELLAMIFVYCFVFAYLGRKNPVLKLVPILLLVTQTGISNAQTYSFMTLVNGIMALLLALAVITVVDQLWTPNDPEQAFLRGTGRFFRGCAQMLRGYAPPRRRQSQAARKRCLDGVVLPIPRQLLKTVKQLDFKRFPGNESENVDHAVAQLLAIGFRLQALEIAYRRVTRHSSAGAEPLGPAVARLREHLQRVFNRWSRFDTATAMTGESGQLDEIARELAARLDGMAPAPGRRPGEDEEGRDLYALLGSVRGLIEAMAHAQEALRAVHWRQWAEERF